MLILASDIWVPFNNVILVVSLCSATGRYRACDQLDQAMFVTIKADTAIQTDALETFVDEFPFFCYGNQLLSIHKKTLSYHIVGTGQQLSGREVVVTLLTYQEVISGRMIENTWETASSPRG